MADESDEHLSEVERIKRIALARVYSQITHNEKRLTKNVGDKQKLTRKIEPLREELVRYTQQLKELKASDLVDIKAWMYLSDTCEAVKADLETAEIMISALSDSIDKDQLILEALKNDYANIKHDIESVPSNVLQFKKPT